MLSIIFWIIVVWIIAYFSIKMAYKDCKKVYDHFKKKEDEA